MCSKVEEEEDAGERTKGEESVTRSQHESNWRGLFGIEWCEKLEEDWWEISEF